MSYLADTLSLLVGRSPSGSLLSKLIQPLIKDENRLNGAISLTQIFSRISFYFCNRHYFGVRKAEHRDREIVLFAASLRRKLSVEAYMLVKR